MDEIFKIFSNGMGQIFIVIVFALIIAMIWRFIKN